MKKIGIFTLTDALNYGAFYQMFALQKYLKEKFVNEYSVTVFSPRENVKGLLVKYFSYNIIRFIRKNSLRSKFNSDLKEVDIKNYKGELLDIAFFGSDEIWNIENKSFINDPNFFGIRVNAKVKIAYAPSIGFAKIESFESYPEFLEGINKLDYILYRDDATKSLVQKAGRYDSQRVVDPTILYDNWSKHQVSIEKKLNKPYLAYYSYISNPPFLESLVQLSKEKNIPIISAGYNTHKWADENLILSPWEFLSFIKNAECVFTTTFHGTIMTTLQNNLVLFSPHSHKVKDFSKLIGLKKYEISKNTSVKTLSLLLNTRIGNNIHLKKNDFKKESQNILNNILSSIHKEMI